MSLKKFEDFENNLEEEDKNALAADHVNAKKELLGSFDKKGSKNEYWTKNHLVKDLGGDTISIATGGEKSVVVKIIGFEI